MKKQVLIGSVLLAAISAFSQNGHVRPKPVGIIDIRTLAAFKYGGLETPPSVKATSASSSSQASPNASKVAATNTWQSFTSSMNMYGVSIPYTKPLQWNNELDAVTFVHRKSATYAISPAPTSNAASGGIVTMVSTDCGVTWDSTAIYSDDTFWGRYPGGAIYNPAGNTDISNAYIVGAGPTTGNGSATSWIGNWYARKKLGAANYNNAPSTVPNAQQIMPTAGPYSPNLGRHDFSAYGFTATDDGKVRVLAGVTDDGVAADSALTLVTGTFNNGVFDWAGTVFNPPTTVASDGTDNFVSRPMMAWNEAGTIGYVVVMGQRLGTTGSNAGFQPIVYKTVNSGASWSLESGINFNTSAYNDVKMGLWPTSPGGDTVPNFIWLEGMDCSVDANNKLHIFSSILGHASSHPDSLSFISQWTSENYLWPHVPGTRPYLYDFMYDGTASTPSWSHMLIDSMSTEGPAGAASGGGYQDNPWDPDPTSSNQKVRIDARIQMSRTPDGKYLVYTWGESDTTFTSFQNKWNVMPNVKARVYNVTTGALNNMELDVTIGGGASVSNRAWFHIVSPKCKFVSDATTGSKLGPILTVPMTVTSSDPYSQLTSNTHWYSCATLEFTVAGSSNVGIDENSLNSVNSSNIFPNPAKNNATLQMNLASASKVQIDVLNTMGQVVKASKVQGQVGANNMNVDLSGLASGIYFVSVKVDNAINTKKLVIE